MVFNRNPSVRDIDVDIPAPTAQAVAWQRRDDLATSEAFIVEVVFCGIAPMCDGVEVVVRPLRLAGQGLASVWSAETLHPLEI